MSQNTYGDISPRTAAYAARELLKRALPLLVLERFGQSKPLKKGQTNAQKFRRYEALALATTALTEGVTPTGSKLTYTDVLATLVQYGDYIPLTDVVLDTHEDPILRESIDIIGEQAAQTLETIRFNAIKGGTNVFYANGSSRGAVNTVITKTIIRAATKALNRQNARRFTMILASSPNYDTHPVEAAYFAVCHPDLKSDIRDISGFISVANYGHEKGVEGELGSVEEVRFICSTIIGPWADAGGTKGTMESTSGTDADVYPILIFAKDAFGIVPLKGASSITPMVNNPKVSDSDPLAQRGSVGWKAYQTAVILNDLWMARLETAATA